MTDTDHIDLEEAIDEQHGTGCSIARAVDVSREKRQRWRERRKHKAMEKMIAEKLGTQSGSMR